MTQSDDRFRAALGHYNAGRGGEARRLCRTIVADEPGHGPANAMLGLMAHREGDLDEAARRFALAVAAIPDDLSHRINLGLSLIGLKRWPDAVRTMRAATIAFPHSAALWSNLGNAHAGTGAWDKAEQAFARAGEAEPRSPAHRYNRALACDKAGRLDRAAHFYKEAMQIAAGHHDARNNLGILLYNDGKLSQAAACFATAYNAAGHAGAGINLARTFRAAGRPDDAAVLAQQVAARHPDLADAHYYLGEILEARGDREDAAACYRQTLNLEADHHTARASLLHASRFLCDMDTVDVLEPTVVAEALDAATRNVRPALNPFMAMACNLTPEQDARIARATAAALAPAAAAAAPLWRRANMRRPHGGRLRIGYLSNDFRDQATSHLAVGLFENHDRDRFEIVAISHTGPSGDGYRQRIETAVDDFIDITALDHGAAAQVIAARGIDVLIDIKGYTKDNRLAVFAHRPAPLQATYLGFPGTTGAPWMDLLIADQVVCPPELARHYSERVVRLAGCYQINDNRAAIADRPADRGACGLPVGAMVYACLNEPWKIDRASFALWCRILAAVPQSILWLRDGGNFASNNLRREAARHGIDSNRLIFAPRLPKPEHLARLRLADLFLDCLVVNAHTTATDALWAGLPLLTVPGSRFPSRVAASLLQAAGLTDLVCDSNEDYLAMAVALGRDKARRESLRLRMADAHCSRLFDSRATTGELERAVLELVAQASRDV